MRAGIVTSGGTGSRGRANTVCEDDVGPIVQDDTRDHLGIQFIEKPVGIRT